MYLTFSSQLDFVSALGRKYICLGRVAAYLYVSEKLPGLVTDRACQPARYHIFFAFQRLPSSGTLPTAARQGTQCLCAFAILYPLRCWTRNFCGGRYILAILGSNISLGQEVSPGATDSHCSGWLVEADHNPSSYRHGRKGESWTGWW